MKKLLMFLCATILVYSGQADALIVKSLPGNLDWENSPLKPLNYEFLIDEYSSANFMVKFDSTPIQGHSYTFQMFIDNESYPFSYEGGWIWHVGVANLDAHLQGSLGGDLALFDGYFSNNLLATIPSNLTGNVFGFSFPSDLLGDIDSDFTYAYSVYVDGKSYGSLFGQSGNKYVPEPATMLLLGVGIVGLAGFGRKRSKK